MPESVGLDADLVLAIDHALADVDRIESALSAATTGIPVSLDVAGIEDVLAAALAAGSAVPVVVSADTTEIPSSIEDAVAAIAPDVTVGADTSEAETAIGGLADAPPVDVPVSADVADAEANIQGLADQPPVDVPVDANIDPAQQEIAAFAASVPPVVVEVDADLTSATEQVSNLGASAASAESAVGGLEGSVAGLGVAAGITEGSAKELLGTLGEMGGEGSGAKAAAGAIGVLSVAAGGFFEEGLQAVSAGQRFDMVLGNMAEKIDDIDVNGLNTSVKDLGLSFGSTEAEMQNVNARLYQNAINAGISKDKAVEFAQQIDTLSARAIALNPQLGTLDEVSGSLGDKLARGGRFAQLYGIQLTAAEIAARALTDTGKTEASELTVVEKSIAGAELASEKYGATLAGTVADGQKNAAIQARELKARFQEAIEQIGVPLVSPVLDLIREAEPDAVIVAETLGRLAKDALPAVAAALDVIGPPLRVVAAVLDEIPDPVVTATLAFFGLNAALEAFSVRLAGVEAETAVFAPEIAILAAAAAAVIGVISVFGDTPTYADEVTRAIDAQSKGFDDLTVSVRDNITAEVDAATRAGDFARRLDEAKLSSAGLTDALLLGGDAWQHYRDGIDGVHYGFGITQGDITGASQDLAHLRDTTEQAAQRTLEKAVADGKLSQADMDAAVSQAGLIDGNKNYAAALDSVQPKLAANVKATADQEEADKRAKDQADAHAAALQKIASSNVAVEMTLVALQRSTGDQTDELQGLAVALNNANLEGKDFDAVAQELGVSTEDLKSFIGAVKAEIDDFVNTAMRGLPTVATAIDEVLNPKKEKSKAIIIDPDKLQAEIDADIAKIDAFNLQMAYLTQHGFDNLAQVAAEKGPEFTSALVTKLQDGGDEMGRTLDSKFGELNTLTRNEPDRLREAGQGIALATGDIATAATKAFGDKFTLREPTQQEIDAAKTVARQEMIPYADALRQVAGDGVAAYTAAAGGLPTATESAMADTHGAVTHWYDRLTEAGHGAGDAAHAGLTAGVAPIPEEAGSAIRAAGAAIVGAAAVLRTVALGEGFLVGQSLGQGIDSGIRSEIAAVARSAADAVNTAEQAARDAADSHSPSELFALLGHDLAAGLALGIADGSAAAAVAASEMVDKAAQSAGDATLAQLAKSVTDVQDNMFALGLTSADEYIAQLRARLSMFVPLSDQWTQTVETMQRVAETEAKQAEDAEKAAADAAAKAAKDAAEAAKEADDAAKKAKEAADAIAAEHQRIHDVEYEVGDLDASAYLDMLNQRMRLEEEAGRKYGEAWKTAYDIAQRVKADIDKAALDKPFQDLADSLDVDVSKLHDFVDKMNQAIDRVVSDAKSSLPTIGSILQKSLDDSGVLDTSKLETNLDDQVKQIEAYTANVDKLMAAGLTRTAQLAIQQGPAAAAALAAAGSTTLEASLAKFDDAQAAVADKAKTEWGPKIIDNLGETAEIAGQVFGDKFTDSFLAQLQGNAPTIEDALNGILSGGGNGGMPGKIAPGTGLPVGVMPIMLPAAAPAVPVQSIGDQYASATRRAAEEKYGKLVHIEQMLIDTGGTPITEKNATQLGESLGAKLGDVLASRLAGIVK